MSARGVPTPGIHDRDVQRAGGKVAQCMRQPEPGFDGLERAHLVRHVDEPQVRRVTEHHALHDADERFARAEVGG